VTCDVTSSGDIAAALQATIDRFGGLDIAFNKRASSSLSNRHTRSATTNGTDL
jgi:NAD(P)-dependent dehydrogenase (short-subunit alcohol dehydrogenase family)